MKMNHIETEGKIFFFFSMQGVQISTHHLERMGRSFATALFNMEEEEEEEEEERNNKFSQNNPIPQVSVVKEENSEKIKQ